MKTRRRRGIVSAVAAVAAVGAVASTALAETQQTQVVVEGLDPITDNSFEVFGGLTSGAHKCIAGREVKLSAQAMPGDPYEPFDTARASANGAWAGAARGMVPNSIKAAVEKTKVGPKHHPTTCGADTEKFTPDK